MVSLRIVFGVLVGLACAVVGGGAMADQIGAERADAVRFKRLSDQQTYPVQVFGKRLKPGTDRIYLAYRVNAVPALMARPGILDCLKPGYPVEPSSFDWEGMRDDAELTVCLHHAFASIGSAEGIAAWLTEAGLEMGMDGGDGSGGASYGRQSMPVYLYDFNWKIEGRGPLSGPLRGDLTAGQGLLQSTITYALDQQGMPIHVVVYHQGTRLK